MEDKKYTFTVKQQELWDAVAKTQREHFKHLSNGCSFGQVIDSNGDTNDNCDCPEDVWK